MIERKSHPFRLWILWVNCLQEENSSFRVIVSTLEDLDWHHHHRNSSRERILDCIRSIIMGMGIINFHPPYGKNEFHYVKKRESEYYFVQPGFFDLQTSIGSVLMTLVQLCYPLGLYILLTYKAWDLFFICKFPMSFFNLILMSLFSLLSLLCLFQTSLQCFRWKLLLKTSTWPTLLTD